ncbi:MAG TPA: hypothetical protein VGK13_01145 [Methanocellaceae archaeon]
MRSIVDFLKYALVLLMFVLFIYSSYFMSAWSFTVPTTTNQYSLPEVKANADPWYDRVIKADEMQSTGWILDHTNKSDRFVADIFGAEMIMGMTTRVSTTGGDWANAPDPVKMMGDTNQIYTTDNATTAHDVAREENATYVYVPDRYTFSGYGWEAVQTDKFNDTRYFQLMYQNPDVSIYKVL